ncbi:MAG: DUF177 domain-containing protein [Chitinophagaceae bacterium]|nr:DUF177 domain-containing protein [Chitinophagaceae bacterium]HMN32150.1 DUF177 domain-containing protein [Chitinophagaceae bacterium]
MKYKREFEIAFVGLKPGIHTFNYNIDDSFFEKFEKPEFNQAKIDINLSLDKKSNIFLLIFKINGKVNIACDRCGDEFELTLWDEFELVVKIVDDSLVEKKSELDAEVAYIGHSESILRIEKLIYEFVILSIPMQHIHLDDENGQSTCNPIALKFLNQNNSNQQSTIWEKLKTNKKLK